MPFNLDQFFKGNILSIIFTVLVSFLLGLLIGWIYKRTHRGLSYSPSFVSTLVLLSVLVSTVMMVVGSNLARAFTLVGAFAIIRFRTAIKDTRDVAFIFWALVAGMAAGTGNFLLAATSSVLITGIVAVLARSRFGSVRNDEHILTFTVDTDRAQNDAYKSVFDTFLSRHTLLNINSRRGGALLEFTFSLAFADDERVAHFVTALRSTSGIDHVNLLTAKEDIEY